MEILYQEIMDLTNRGYLDIVVDEKGDLRHIATEKGKRAIEH